MEACQHYADGVDTCCFMYLLIGLLRAADAQGLPGDFGPAEAVMLLEPLQLPLESHEDRVQDIYEALRQGLESGGAQVQ